MHLQTINMLYRSSSFVPVHLRLNLRYWHYNVFSYHPIGRETIHHLNHDAPVLSYEPFSNHHANNFYWPEHETFFVTIRTIITYIFLKEWLGRWNAMVSRLWFLPIGIIVFFFSFIIFFFNNSAFFSSLNDEFTWRVGIRLNGIRQLPRISTSIIIEFFAIHFFDFLISMLNFPIILFHTIPLTYNVATLFCLPINSFSIIHS